MKAFLLKYKLWVIIGLIIVGGGSIFIAKRNNKLELETATAEKRTIVRDVGMTGRVKPVEKVDLAFDEGGRIALVSASVGKDVGAGELLVQLESADLNAQRVQADANILAEEARLEALKRGTRPEEIQVAEVKVANAGVSLDDAKRNLENTLNDTFTKAENAIHADVDQFFMNPKTANPQLTFATTPSLKSEIEFQRVAVENTLTAWASDRTSLEASRKSLEAIRTFLEKVSVAVNSLSPTTGFTQTNIDAYRAGVSGARTTINTSLTNVTAAQEKVRSAESSKVLAEEELKLKKAGTTSEDIKQQEAKIESAKAEKNLIVAKLAKRGIRAPIAGTITMQEARVGEIASIGKVLVSLSSASGFEVEANVPEADIARLRVGNEATVMLDAHGDTPFAARVVEVDPAETIVDGVATYKVRIQFVSHDDRIRSGMTANVDVVTDRKENVMALPERFVRSKDGRRIVLVLGDDEISIEQEVTIGIRGSDGMVEILSGLAEGARVTLAPEER